MRDDELRTHRPFSGASKEWRFFRTAAGPGATAYPAEAPGVNVYYARELKGVSFEKSVGARTVTFTESNRYNYVCNLEPDKYIEEGSVVLCFLENGRWWTIDKVPTEEGCDYADQFEYLRDYEISLTPGNFLGATKLSNSAAQAPAGVGPVDLSQPFSAIHDAVGGGGWYTSQLRPQLTLEVCIDQCEVEGEPGRLIFYEPAIAWWSVATVNQGASRLFCRKSPTPSDGPEGNIVFCTGGGVLPDTIRRSAGGPGWNFWDCGHLLRSFAAANATEPVMSIEAFLHNDPTYATSHYTGLRNGGVNLDGCNPADTGGYWDWGLHLGEPTYGAATTSPGDTGTSNVVRLGIDRSAELYGSTSGTAYLRIWDTDGEFTEVSLGTVTTSLAASVHAKLTFTRVGNLWNITAECGGHTHTRFDVALTLDDGVAAPVAKLGVYCLSKKWDDSNVTDHHGGGEWSALCVQGVATPDACGDCTETNLPTGWLIDTEIDPAFYAAALGDCAAPLTCQHDGDPWGGPQFLGPVEDSADCCWLSCLNAYACLSGGGCVIAGPSIGICEVEHFGVPELRLQYYYYTGSSPQALSQQVLATYYAPVADVCGPATFIKDSEAGGGDLFPATISAQRAWPPAECKVGGGDACCPGLSPDLTAIWQGEPAEEPTITITPTDCDSEIAGSGVCSYLWHVAFDGGDWFCEGTIEAHCVSAEAGGTLYWYVKVGIAWYIVTSPTGCDPLDLIVENVDLSSDFQCVGQNMPEAIVTFLIG